MRRNSLLRRAIRERNAQIIQLYQENKYSYQDLADMFGITKQRVYQIIHSVSKTQAELLTPTEIRAEDTPDTGEVLGETPQEEYRRRLRDEL